MKIDEFNESTTSGSIASVAAPIGKMKTRGKGVYPNQKGGNLFTGKKTSKTITEDEISEQDLIMVPGQGKQLKPGFVSNIKAGHAVEMAKSDLYHAAKNAKTIYEIVKNISEEQGLPGWVQEKIIKADDYLSTVREYMEHKEFDSSNDSFDLVEKTDADQSTDPYKAGLKDGLSKLNNPRASEIYGPGADDYQRGVNDGLRQADQQQKDTAARFQHDIESFEQMSLTDLEEKMQEVKKRKGEIADLFRQARGSAFTYDPKKHAPDNHKELEKEYKLLAKDVDLINQAISSKKNNESSIFKGIQYENKGTHYPESYEQENNKFTRKSSRISSVKPR